MRIQSSAAILGLVLVTGCLSQEYTGPLGAEVRSDPAILYLGVGETKTVIVEAFVGNDPESVRWSIGTTGAGLDVVEDSSYGQTYVGGELTLPPQSHSRRYQVTMNDSVETSFVISGGTAVTTIQVRPPTP